MKITSEDEGRSRVRLLVALLFMDGAVFAAGAAAGRITRGASWREAAASLPAIAAQPVRLIVARGGLRYPLACALKRIGAAACGYLRVWNAQSTRVLGTG